MPRRGKRLPALSRRRHQPPAAPRDAHNLFSRFSPNQPSSPGPARPRRCHSGRLRHQNTAGFCACWLHRGSLHFYPGKESELAAGAFSGGALMRSVGPAGRTTILRLATASPCSRSAITRPQRPGPWAPAMGPWAPAPGPLAAWPLAPGPCPWGPSALTAEKRAGRRPIRQGDARTGAAQSTKTNRQKKNARVGPGAGCWPGPLTRLERQSVGDKRVTREQTPHTGEQKCTALHCTALQTPHTGSRNAAL
jgi:hypothetical protein